MEGGGGRDLDNAPALLGLPRRPFLSYCSSCSPSPRGRPCRAGLGCVTWGKSPSLSGPASHPVGRPQGLVAAASGEPELEGSSDK